MPLTRGLQPNIESAFILHHNLVIVITEVRFVAVLRALAQHSLTVLAVIEAHEMATRGVVLPGIVTLSLLLVHINRCQDYRWRRVIDVRVMLHLIEGRQRILHRFIIRVEVLVLVRLHRCIIRAGLHIIVIFRLFVCGDHSMTSCYETASAQLCLVILHMFRREVTVLKDLRVEVPQNLGPLVHSVLALLLSLDVDFKRRLGGKERSGLRCDVQVTFLLLIRQVLLNFSR